MKISIQKKTISGNRTQFQLSYTINGRRVQRIVPNAIYSAGASKREKQQAMTLAERASAELLSRLDGQSITAVINRAIASAELSRAKVNQLKRVAELWQAAGASNTPIASLTTADVIKFANTLSRYSANTQRSYIAQFVWVINQEPSISREQRERLTSALEKPSAEKDNRAYIEPQDIERLFATPIPTGVTQLIADAFMLSYYTGLRYSDIRQLTRDNITPDYIRVTMRKTGGVISVPIAPTTRSILERNPKLFANLPMQTTQANRELTLWSNAAGVRTIHADGSRGSVTFHAARHSCATALLNKGVAIEQVSALLGHKSISTTQVYAKIVNSTLAAAVALL